jgi:hypothetical protein
MDDPSHEFADVKIFFGNIKIETSMIQKSYVVKIKNGRHLLCGLCGEEITNPQDVTVEHMISRPSGKDDVDVAENMMPAHRECSRIRNGMEINQFYEKYFKDKKR